MLDLHYLLYSGGADCVFITESWLNNDITAGLLDPKNEFVIFRNDRSGLTGGGSLDARRVDMAQLDSRVEMLCLDIYGANVINRFFSGVQTARQFTRL